MQLFVCFNKTSDFDCDLRLSPERVKISKIGKTGDQERFIVPLAKKSDGIWYLKMYGFKPTVLMVGLLVQCCVCHLSVRLCVVAKRCILVQQLLLRAYRKSYVRNRLVPK